MVTLSVTFFQNPIPTDWQISYTRQMKSRTEYVRGEWVEEIRRQITTYKRFKHLIDQWTDLNIERSKLTMQIAEPKATC